MPVLRDVSLNLNMDQVLRRQDIGARSKLRPELMAVLHELLATIEDLHLLEPAIAYEFRSINEVFHDRLSSQESESIGGSLLSSILPSAKELAVVVCTIGPRLEEKVACYSSRKEPMQALILDGIGSAAVDLLAQEACHFISHEASSHDYQASSPLNPGMPGLPISEQWQLFQLVPAEQIGVHLTSSAMMVPRKSVSMIIGIGPDMPTWTQAEVCNRCRINKACPYKAKNQLRTRPELEHDTLSS
jgi:hypothetical protein